MRHNIDNDGYAEVYRVKFAENVMRWEKKYRGETIMTRANKD